MAANETAVSKRHLIDCLLIDVVFLHETGAGAAWFIGCEHEFRHAGVHGWLQETAIETATLCSLDTPGDFGNQPRLGWLRKLCAPMACCQAARHVPRKCRACAAFLYVLLRLWCPWRLQPEVDDREVVRVLSSVGTPCICWEPPLNISTTEDSGVCSSYCCGCGEDQCRRGSCSAENNSVAQCKSSSYLSCCDFDVAAQTQDTCCVTRAAVPLSLLQRFLVLTVPYSVKHQSRFLRTGSPSLV